MKSKKIKKYTDKIKKLENSNEYKPRAYFEYQLKTGCSLPKSIKNTCNYIDKNLSKSNYKKIFKLYGKIDFNNKQLFNIFSSITVALVTGVLVNFISNADFTEFINNQSQFISQLIAAFIIGIVMLIPISIVVAFSFWLIICLKKDYIDNYNMFVAPYERKEVIKRIEKEIDDYKYRKSLE